MTRYNEDLDKELKLLGFDNYREMLAQTPYNFSNLEGSKDLRSKEGIAPAGPYGTDRMEFHFTIGEEEKTNRLHITSIRIDLLKAVDTVEPRLVNRRFYQKSAGDFPTKALMVQEMTRMEASRVERLENANKIIEQRASLQQNLGESTKSSLGVHRL